MKIRIRKRSLLPKCLRGFKELKGICVGGCVDKTATIDKDHAAHAHCNRTDKYRGWICLHWKYQLKERLTLLHEMAHIIANVTWDIPHHGRAWKQALLKIGGTFKAFCYTHNGITRENLDYTYRNNKL